MQLVETMDSISKKLLLFLCLSSLHLLTNGTRPFHIVHHDIRSDLLKFCEHTTNPSLCAETIQPHVLDGDIDPFKALEIEVEATLNETKKAIAIIDELLLTKNNINNKSLMSAFNTCKEQYNYILDSIKETKDAIAQHDLIEAKFKFSAVISYQSTCMDEFEHVECPFAEDSETIFNLGGNTLDIIADLEKTVAPQQPIPTAPSTDSSQSSSTSINVIGTIS
ncbi:putative pectinesterase inhibitor domain-containing protein [Lupinus albus]|uniref:Putative pectinesterase inhibitor domain-containing protein n=1 Tax=Lupinus albus TaxID=3870 RepID=A0A6A4NZP5_LUPAL|nr:putative pectinesterase inhibitor domain-containing protein [Lupinus albus]